MNSWKQSQEFIDLVKYYMAEGMTRYDAEDAAKEELMYAKYNRLALNRCHDLLKAVLNLR